MPRRYRSAPGCPFPEVTHRNDIARHLRKKAWCPCKDAAWTVRKALDEASVTRQTRLDDSHVSQTTPVTQHTRVDDSHVSQPWTAPARTMDILSSELVRQGVYIGRPCGIWTELTTSGQPDRLPVAHATVLKFGCSDDCVKRVNEHQRTYKGFELLAWYPTCDYRRAESKFRTQLQMSGRLAHGWNSNKNATDKELVLAESEEDLAAVQRTLLRCAGEAPVSMDINTTELRLEEHRTRQLEHRTRQLELELELARFRAAHRP